MIDTSFAWTRVEVHDAIGVPSAAITAPFDMAVVSVQQSLGMALYRKQLSSDEVSDVAVDVWYLQYVDGVRSVVDRKSKLYTLDDFMRSDAKEMFCNDFQVQAPDPADA